MELTFQDGKENQPIIESENIENSVFKFCIHLQKKF